MTLDRRAVQILTNTFWTAAGWRRERSVSAEDFDYAKAGGLMFDPLSLSHDEAVESAIAARDALSKTHVVGAFIASLRSRRLDLRSGLGSYAVARHLVKHELMRQQSSRACAICGGYESSDIDLNVLSVERIKWGGVRHSQPSYIGFDLSRLASTPTNEPEDEDHSMLKHIVEIARSMPPTAKLKDLDKALASVVPSNSAERRTLIGILGYCGILIDNSKPDFRKQFVPYVEREHTGYAKDDWPFPVQWWRGWCGLKEDAVKDWFPDWPG
ncbi:hypothetical protein ACSBOB_31210 [Mesorhizobium sp. ASY16-5R]|uniref:hypothetical protein n=1 Tax=Mesorhizobium sp. ASY16-5R TaxID=3445772 RepID=UPI003FA033CF